MAAEPIEDITALFRIYQSGLAFHAVCAVTRLGVPDRLAKGPRPIGELAVELNADEDALRRVLHLLAGHGIVRVDAARDTAELSGTGALLDSAHPMSLHATFATLGISDVAHALPDVIRTGRPAAPQVLGTGFWDYLAQRPAMQQTFSQAMAEQARLLALPCVDLVDWPVDGTVADIGGGSGALITAVLDLEPDARGIVVDQPQVLDATRRRLRDAGLADRCTAVPGDLFAPPPAADLYVLSRVLHDWDDDQVVQILRAVAESAGPDARLRLFEDLLPEDAVPSAAQCWSDVVMMALYDGARERSTEQFRRLLAEAGWRLEKTVAGVPGINIIDAVRVPSGQETR